MFFLPKLWGSWYFYGLGPINNRISKLVASCCQGAAEVEEGDGEHDEEEDEEMGSESEDEYPTGSVS